LLDEAFRAASAAVPSLEYVSIESDAEALRQQLHLSIIEMTAGCLKLFAGRIFSPIPILIRVSYEALADQTTLGIDPTYASRMLKTSLDEGGGLPDLLNQHDTEKLQDFIRGPGARAFLGTLKRKSRDLESESPRRPSAEEKFEAAGMEKEYLMHRLMSGHVHNATAALTGRHATKQSDGTRSGTRLSKYPAMPICAGIWVFRAAPCCAPARRCTAAIRIFGRTH
jgi:Family of unknown function (DUF5677)